MGVQHFFNWRRKPIQEKLARRGKLGRNLIVLASAAIGVGSLGCSGFSGISHQISHNSAWNDFVQGYRNSVWSAKAWHCRKNQFCGEKYLHDFSVGFRAGYEDVAAGSNGCTPAFAPREYWGWKYQSAEGQAKVAAWFSGYPHGARAAEEDGVGNWTQIQTSSGIQKEYCQFGMMGSEEVGMYPIPESGQGRQMNLAQPNMMQTGMPMEGTIIEPSMGRVEGSASDRPAMPSGAMPRITPVPDNNVNRP